MTAPGETDSRPVLSHQPMERAFYAHGRRVMLSPKAYAVLSCLADSPGKLCTKRDLLDKVWAHVEVSEAVLKTAIREIRKAVGEEAGSAQFIETRPRIGYRMIARVHVGNTQHDADALPPMPQVFVGRDDELARLRRTLDCAPGLTAQLLIGEPGMGKSTLLAKFLDNASRNEPVWRPLLGRAIQQFGVGEPDLPWLDIVSAMSADPFMLHVLEQHAPTWCARPGDGSTKLLGATAERRARELVDALLALSRKQPLLIAIDDLHWADHGSLNVMSLLIRRAAGHRLRVIATCRDRSQVPASHPASVLMAELVAQGFAEQHILPELSTSQIGDWLRAIHSGLRVSDRQSEILKKRGAGNPLFLTNIIRHLERDGHRIDATSDLDARLSSIDALPDALRPLLLQRLESLPPAQHEILVPLAVAVDELDAGILAMLLECPDSQVKSTGLALCRDSAILRAHHDGHGPLRFDFVHALYKLAMRESLSDTEVAHWNLRLGEALECLEGTAPSLLARYFHAGGHSGKAARYLLASASIHLRKTALSTAMEEIGLAVGHVWSLPENERKHLLLEAFRLRVYARLAQGMAGFTHIIQDAEAWIAAATDADDFREIIRAYVALTRALVSYNRSLCLHYAARGIEVARTCKDPLTRRWAEGLLSFWPLNLDGWSDSIAAIFDAALEDMRIGTIPSDYQLCAAASYTARLRGRYAESLALAEEATAGAIAHGDNYTYLAAQSGKVYGNVLLGNWETAGQILQSIAVHEQRNAHPIFTRLAMGFWLLACREAGADKSLQQALDYLVTGSEGLPEARADLILSRALQLRLAADTGLSRSLISQANELEALITRCPQAGHTVMMPLLRIALAEHWLALDDPQKAEVYANEAHALAGAPGEPTYLIQSSTLLARIEYRNGRSNNANEYWIKAKALYDSCPLPLATLSMRITAKELGREFFERENEGLEAAISLYTPAIFDAINGPTRPLD